MITSLQEIGARLGHHRIRGDQLTSPHCPCCGGHARRSKTALAVRDRGDHLVFTCHLCHADWREIERRLGIARGGDHADACARDEGPFHPDAAVLANVRPWRFTPSEIAFPDDEVGRCARILFEHVPDARRATKRLKHDPDEPPYCVRFSVAAVRRARKEQFSQRVVEAACRLLQEMFVTSEYRTRVKEEDGTEKTLLFIIVHRELRSALSSSYLKPVTPNCLVTKADRQDQVLLEAEALWADLRANPPPDAETDLLIATWAVGL